MAEVWEVFGHHAVKKLLAVQLESGHLSQAYLFRSTEAVGKKSLALEFAKKILGTKELVSHPDFSILDAVGEITVEQIHDFMQPLFFKPFAGAKKVAILNNAQNLNTQSGNALLKTLEEPSGSTIIILVASGQVLPTIISRCQTFYFTHFPQREMDSYAAAQKINPALAGLSFGRIGRLREIAENPDSLKESEEQIDGLKQLAESSVGQRLAKVSQYSDLETPELEQLLQTWILWLRYELKKSPQKFKSLKSCLDALDSLKHNQNKKLILQSLFLNLQTSSI